MEYDIFNMTMILRWNLSQLRFIVKIGLGFGYFVVFKVDLSDVVAV